jgi:hypothetical protein
VPDTFTSRLVLRRIVDAGHIHSYLSGEKIEAQKSSKIALPCTVDPSWSTPNFPVFLSCCVLP